MKKTQYTRNVPTEGEAMAEDYPQSQAVNSSVTAGNLRYVQYRDAQVTRRLRCRSTLRFEEHQGHGGCGVAGFRADAASTTARTYAARAAYATRRESCPAA
jgi:hypothetical protein